MILNEGQSKAKIELLETINTPYPNDSNRFHTLRGGAGFGKSTLIVDIIRDIRITKKICIAAPTHKAVKVIDDMLKREKLEYRVDTNTIHSVLGLKLIPSEDREIAIKDEYSKEKVYDILLIDECSMLDDYMINYILDSQSKIIIFIGDEYQISPVGSAIGEVSSTFTEVSKQSKLHEVVRCAKDNPIFKLSMELRDCQDYDHLGLPNIVTDLDKDDNGIYKLPPTQFVETLYQHVTSPEFNDDVDYARCIVFHNKKANEINDHIRKRIHGNDVDDYLVGDILVAQETNASEFTHNYKNSEEVKVVSIEKDICYDGYVDGIPVYIMTVENIAEETFCEVKVIAKEGLSKYEHTLKTLIQKAKSDPTNAKKLWRDFYRIKKGYSFFKHVYCMTAHKSQGSTFKNTFVYLPDFMERAKVYGLTKDIKELIYTATTRSSHRTYFC